MAEQLTIKYFRDAAIAEFVQIHSVERQGPWGVPIGLLRCVEQVDKRNITGLGNFLHDLRVHLETGIVFGPVGEVRVVEVFMGDR